MKAGFAIGFRPGSTPERDRLWAKVLPHLEATGYTIYTAEPDPGPFNHAQSQNRAAEKAIADGVTTLITADADTIFPDSLHEAVRLSQETGQAVWPYDHIMFIAPDGRQAGRTIEEEWAEAAELPDRPMWVIQPDVGPVLKMPNRYPLMTNHLVVPVDLYRKVGGWDERLNGYGFEDTMFALACDLLGGGLLRVPGTLTMYDHSRPPGHSPYDDQRVTPAIDQWLKAHERRDPDYAVLAAAAGLVARGAAQGDGWALNRDGSLRVTPTPRGVPS